MKYESNARNRASFGLPSEKLCPFFENVTKPLIWTRRTKGGRPPCVRTKAGRPFLVQNDPVSSRTKYRSTGLRPAQPQSVPGRSAGRPAFVRRPENGPGQPRNCRTHPYDTSDSQNEVKNQQTHYNNAQTGSTNIRLHNYKHVNYDTHKMHQYTCTKSTMVSTSIIPKPTT